MFKLIGKIPLIPLAIAAIVMALAPFVPEPHLAEKIRMLVNGDLTRPVDIFDLFWHSFLIVILLLRLMHSKKSTD